MLKKQKKKIVGKKSSFLFALFLILALFVFIDSEYRQDVFAFFSFYAGIFYLLILLPKIRNIGNVHDRYARRKGHLGEERVIGFLKKLPKDYLCIHNFLTNAKGNVDHIVIAPAGVFLIETKNTSGVYSVQNKTLLRNNKLLHKSYIKQVHAQLYYWRGALKLCFDNKFFVPVYGVLELLNTNWVEPEVFELLKENGMHLCLNDYIIKYLLKYGKKPRLTPEQQYQVYDFIQLMNRKK